MKTLRVLEAISLLNLAGHLYQLVQLFKSQAVMLLQQQMTAKDILLQILKKKIQSVFLLVDSIIVSFLVHPGQGCRAHFHIGTYQGNTFP